jgi:hypothetical protein
MGKILLGFRHILYVYKHRVNDLLRLICNICYCPVKNSPKQDKHKDVENYSLIYKYYSHACNCTGSDDKAKGLDVIICLDKVYDHFEDIDSVQILKDIFGLKSRDDVLVDYILIPCYNLLKQLHNGTHILYEIHKLFEKINRKSRPIDAYKQLDKLCNSAANSLRDKKGIIRQNCVPI